MREMSDFEFGVRELAEYLLAMAVDDEHHGDLNCADVHSAAAAFGVIAEDRK